MADFAIPAREYALVFGTAVVVTFLLTGVVRLIAVRMGVVTPIRDRDVHSLPIPQGSESTGTLYFDVTGAPPNGVVYNDGMQDILIWTSNVPGASAPGAAPNSPSAPQNSSPAPGALPGPATT